MLQHSQLKKSASQLIRRVVTGLVISLGVANLAHAVPVGILAGGGFGGTTLAGNKVADTNPFVSSGLMVQVGDIVSISATGSICLSGSCAGNGPDGQIINFPPHYTVLGNIFGAVIGAIVADDSGSFQAYDSSDVANGIAASSVFLIGSSLTFTAQQAGKLYFGVADSAFFDNGGPGFEVTASARTPNDVPEPASLALLAIGLAGMGYGKRKKA